MGVSKNDKQSIDSDIIEHLMIVDKDVTATAIAKAIGLKKAKDVSGRLASLHSKNIIHKIKVQNQVFWTIDQLENTKSLKSPYAKEIDPGDLIPSDDEYAESKLTNKTNNSRGYDDLILIIDQMRKEICLLRSKVDNIIPQYDTNTNMYNSIPTEIPSPIKTPAQELFSWSPVSGNKRSTATPSSCEKNGSSRTNKPNFHEINPMWCTGNQFSSLAFDNSTYNDCQDNGQMSNQRQTSNSTESSYSNDSAFVKQAKTKTARRPSVCTSESHLTNFRPPIRAQSGASIVPGLQKYSKVHENVISIVTDSMTNRIRSRDFNQDLPAGTRAIFKKFPGAVASEIKEYANVTIDNDVPRGLIAVAGTNDISYRGRDKHQPDVLQIAQNIIDIGLNARRKGVRNIFIASIITRTGFRHEVIRRQVNKILYSMCINHKFYFINNDNIGLEHLWEDGLHLNDSGATILKKNMARCFDESLYVY